MPSSRRREYETLKAEEKQAFDEEMSRRLKQYKHYRIEALMNASMLHGIVLWKFLLAVLLPILHVLAILSLFLSVCPLPAVSSILMLCDIVDCPVALRPFVGEDYFIDGFSTSNNEINEDREVNKEAGWSINDWNEVESRPSQQHDHHQQQGTSRRQYRADVPSHHHHRPPPETHADMEYQPFSSSFTDSTWSLDLSR